MSLLLRFWNLSIRLEEEIIPPETEKLLQSGRGFLLAIWHNNMASLVVYCHKNMLKKHGIHISPLASHSKDGEFISMTVARFGFQTTRGSSSKGGAAGALALIKATRNGIVPLFTVDGPKGPLYEVKPGVIEVASLTGLPIIILLTTYDRFIEFSKAWDKHRFPRWGAKQLVLFSEPIYIPQKISKEQIITEAKNLENKMKELWEALEKKAQKV